MTFRNRLSNLRHFSVERNIDFINIPVGYILISLFAASPVIIAMLADWTGELIGCNINEGATDSCVVFGIPIGTILSMFFIMGWFALITIPGGLLLMLLWTVKSYREIAAYFQNRKNERAHNMRF